VKRARQDRFPEAAYYTAVGRAIQASRAELGISRRELASRSGISYSYMADIERGRRKLPANRILAIAQSLGMTPSDLLARAERYIDTEAESYAVLPPQSEVAYAAEKVDASLEMRALLEPPRPESVAYYRVAEPHPSERIELHRMIDLLDPRDFGLVASFLRRLLRR
jgi:transcriptional regulator with XRE-family HTH domain